MPYLLPRSSTKPATTRHQNSLRYDGEGIMWASNFPGAGRALTESTLARRPTCVKDGTAGVYGPTRRGCKAGRARLSGWGKPRDLRVARRQRARVVFTTRDCVGLCAEPAFGLDSGAFGGNGCAVSREGRRIRGGRARQCAVCWRYS